MQQKDKDVDYETKFRLRSPRQVTGGFLKEATGSVGESQDSEKLIGLTFSRTETPILRPEKLKAQTGHMASDPLLDTLQ